jgi:hypothetical protein
MSAEKARYSSLAHIIFAMFGNAASNERTYHYSTMMINLARECPQTMFYILPGVRNRLYVGEELYRDPIEIILMTVTADGCIRNSGEVFASIAAGDNLHRVLAACSNVVILDPECNPRSDL